jgi:hypothetical protein
MDTPRQPAPCRAAPLRGTGVLAWCVFAVVSMAGGPAAAEWRRSDAIDWSTAYTIDEGSLTVGVLSPLIVGVTDDLQVALHPILLLVGKPSVSLRVRLGEVGPVAFSVDLGGVWSFLRRVDIEGREPAEGSGVKTGFPGTAQVTTSATVRLGRHWLVTGGVGAGADFLDGTLARGLMELHASAHWLPSSRHLVMVQLSTFVDPRGSGALVRPSAQLLYAWAASSRVRLGLGVAFGRFLWESGPGQSTNLVAFPIIDAWFRF